MKLSDQHVVEMFDVDNRNKSWVLVRLSCANEDSGALTDN